MRIKLYIPGEQVIISNDISKTKNYYGINLTMLSMRNGVFKLDSISGDDLLVINGFNWHPDDVKPFSVEPPLKIEICMFDPNNLIL